MTQDPPSGALTLRHDVQSIVMGVEEILRATDVELEPHRKAIQMIDSTVWEVVVAMEQAHQRAMTANPPSDEQLFIDEEAQHAQDTVKGDEHGTG